MEDQQEELARIKEELKRHPDGLSITDIAGSLHLNRNSVAKYLDILQIQGMVDGRKRGTSKVYYLSRRIPADALKKICLQPFIILDQDGIATDYNQQFSRITGLSAEQIRGRGFDQFPFKILEGDTTQQIFRVALRGTEQKVRASLFLNDTETPVHLTLIPLVFTTGKPGVAIITGDDDLSMAGGSGLSDTINPELRMFLDHQIEYAVRYTPEGIILWVNEPYCQAMARSREDLIGRPFKHLVPTEDTQRIAANRQRLNPKYPAGMVEFRAIMANGEARWQRWWDRALFDDRGQLTGYFSCGLDITEEVLIRSKLRKSQDMLEETIVARTNELREINRQLYDEMSRRETIEQQLQLTQFAMDNAADMVFWVNRNGHVDYVNKAAVSGGGYTTTDLTETSLNDIFPILAAHAWSEIWEHLKREGTESRQIEMVRKDGTRIPVEMLIRYLEYHKNEFVCCFVRDISERKRMELTLHLANKKLNLLTSIARHDIQNKVTVLLGYLSRAKKRETDPVIREYLDRQEQAAMAIRDEIAITRDFKDLGVSPPEWLDIHDVIAGVAARFSTMGAKISVDLPPHLFVYADRQMERVFFRLFENAARASSSPPSIQVFSYKDRDRFVICVEYDRTGITDRESADKGILEPGSSSLQIIREILSLTDLILEEVQKPPQGVRYEIAVPAISYRQSPVKGT